MYPKAAVAVVCAAAACAAFAMVSLASAAPRSGATTIKTLQIVTSFAPKGTPGIGTVWAGQANHFDPTTGKKIGHGWAVCVQFTPGANGMLDCQGDDHFAGGDIREAGVFANPALLRWAIVGGTGAYRDAAGVVEWRSVGKSTTHYHSTFTIDKLGG